MSKVAWKTSHLYEILGTNLKILQWFGIGIVPAEISEIGHLNLFQRFCWPLVNLATYAFVIGCVFPRVIDKETDSSVSYFNKMLALLNYWMYNVSVFVGILRTNRSASSLWHCMEELEHTISLSAATVLRCRRTCTLLFYAIAPVVSYIGE